MCLSWWCLFHLQESREWSSSGIGFGPHPIHYLSEWSSISGKVPKFADDTKLYATVDNQAHGQSLQRDIDILGDWALQWQMKFNIDKCKVVHYGRNNIRFQYSLYGQLQK